MALNPETSPDPAELRSYLRHELELVALYRRIADADSSARTLCEIKVRSAVADPRCHPPQEPADFGK